MTGIETAFIWVVLLLAFLALLMAALVIEDFVHRFRQRRRWRKWL